MRSQFEFVDSLIGCRVNHCDCAGLFVPVADVYSLLRRIIAKVIYIIPKVDGADQIESGAIVDIQLPLVASHKYLVRPLRIHYALRGLAPQRWSESLSAH